MEDDPIRPDPALLSALLKDHTMSQGCPDTEQVNIIWATHDYEHLGPGYGYHDQIRPELIAGDRHDIVMPRVRKGQQVQDSRKRDRAEVFTPAWICNSQNNLVDAEWFGRPDVFNRELPDHSWEPTPAPIAMPPGRTWMDYVRDTRLEITCGEAPYLVSRYDASTGQPIALTHRIGLLDRKLRIVGENTSTPEQWLRAAHEAYRSLYGYEWQGDSLFIARQSMLLSFIEYYQARWGHKPARRSCLSVAYTVTWNLFQMDGLRGVVPDTCHPQTTTDLFGGQTVTPCPGCATDNLRLHNGRYCLIRDWHAQPARPGHGPGRKMRFIDLIK